jgi:plastocyanin
MIAIQSHATGPVSIMLTIPQGASVMGNPSYEPNPLTINAGETIMVENEDSTPHTVTNGKDATDPDMGKLFDTSIINAGDSSEIVTTDLKPGEYPFFCSVHPYMTGTLDVQVGVSEQMFGQSPLNQSTKREQVAVKADPDLIRELLSDIIDNLRNNNTERALAYMDIVRQQLLPQSNVSSTFRLISSLVDDATEAIQKGDSNTALSDLDIADERLILLTNNTQTALADNRTATVERTDREDSVGISQELANNTKELEVEQRLEEAKDKIGQLRQQENSEAESAVPSLPRANQTTFASPYLDYREQQEITEEDLLQFANNGTSFDDYFKQRINSLNKTGKLTLDAAVEKISSNQSALTKGANVCMSPLGQMFGAFICDYTLSLVYEFCQTIPNPNQFIVCASPTIANYLAERNIPDGQTDRLAWLFPTLDLSELTDNPFDDTS